MAPYVRKVKCGVPYLTQTHGMVMPSGHPLARPLDALMTRRALRAASANLYLTDVERLGLGEVVGPLAGLVMPLTDLSRVA